MSLQEKARKYWKMLMQRNKKPATEVQLKKGILGSDMAEVKTITYHDFYGQNGTPYLPIRFQKMLNCSSHLKLQKIILR